MAKVDIGQLSPDAVPRVRGVFLVQPWRGIWTARKWPRKRPGRASDIEEWYRALFAYAGRWASNPSSLDLITAQAMTRGTEWMPRDLLIKAMYGTAYEVVLPDGTVAAIGSKAPPPPTRPPVQSWQSDAWDTVDDTVTSTSAFAFKGGRIAARIDMDIASIMADFTAVNAASYRAIVATINTSNVITAISNGDIIVAQDAERRWRELPVTASLTAGNRYAILIGRTDGGNTYVFPCQTTLTPKFQFPFVNLGAGRIAKTAPVVGDTIDTAGGLLTWPPVSLLASY